MAHSKPKGAHKRRARRAPAKRIFTECEKSALSKSRFRDLNLDDIDFRGANLRGAEFVDVSLAACDFQGADLRGARFVNCDLRRARFEGAALAGNRFDSSWLTGASGLSDEQRHYVERRGGSFLRAVVFLRGSSREP